MLVARPETVRNVNATVARYRVVEPQRGALLDPDASQLDPVTYLHGPPGPVKRGKAGKVFDLGGYIAAANRSATRSRRPYDQDGAAIVGLHAKILVFEHQGAREIFAGPWSDPCCRDLGEIHSTS
jgi:hypothetical protein